MKRRIGTLHSCIGESSLEHSTGERNGGQGSGRTWLDSAKCDLAAHPFDDARFDAVITVYVYHLVGDRARAMDESLRVLKRPGVLLNGYDHHDDGGRTAPDRPVRPTGV
jgi:SAM-dependent methyltransferase